MSAQVMSWLLHDGPRDLSGSDLVVAMVLAEHTNAETGVAYPSVPRIAKMARMSERQVQRVLQNLQTSLCIEVAWEATNKRPKGYRFCAFRGDMHVTSEEPSVGVTSTKSRGDIQGKPEVTSTSPKLNGRERSNENVIPPSPSESPPKGERAKAKHPIPDDWELTNDLRRYALENGIPASQVDHVAAEFKHYWQSEGRGKCNWSQAFQGRVREKAQYYQARQERNDINANILHIGDYQQKRTAEEQAALDEERRRYAEKDRERRGGLTREEAWRLQNQEQARANVPR